MFNSATMAPMLTDHDFAQIQRLMRDQAGLHLKSKGKPAVGFRLLARLRALNMSGFREYIECISAKHNHMERQRAVDLLTTHETYFFREPQHFDYLTKVIVPQLQGGPVRAWSAAASSGEEAYSIAMVLMATLGDAADWNVLGTDVSQDSVFKARKGIYAPDRLDSMPASYQKRYRPSRTNVGDTQLIMPDSLRNRVSFQQHNLVDSLPGAEQFDVIFLRNVMIYFDLETQTKVIGEVCRQLKPGGWLILGHAEVVCRFEHKLKPETSTIFRNVGMAH